MVIQKHKKELTQDVKQMLKYLFFLIPLMNYSQIIKKIENSELTINKYKSINDVYCYITVSTYEFEKRDNKLPASYYLNNIILDDIIINENIIKEKSLSILPGQFKLTSLYFGKTKKEINFLIEKGDSLVVKFYLKDEQTINKDPDIIIEKSKNK